MLQCYKTAENWYCSLHRRNSTTISKLILRNMVMFIRMFLVVLFVEAKFDWKFQIKRGGQEPWRPFQTNQLLERIDQKRQRYQHSTIVQKVKNVKLRDLLSKISGKGGVQNNHQNKEAYRMNRLRRFHKNWLNPSYFFFDLWDYLWSTGSRFLN